MGKVERVRDPGSPGRAITGEDYEDFFEYGAMALHLVSGDGTILNANRAELDLLGYTSEEYIGRQISDFHADPATISEMLDRLAAGEKLIRFPARLRAKGGSIRYVEVTSSAQFRDGEFINTRCFTSDVTEIAEMRRQLARKDEEMRQVLEALPAAVYTTLLKARSCISTARRLTLPAGNPSSVRTIGRDLPTVYTRWEATSPQ